MGAALAEALAARHDVLWTVEGRSEATARRARAGPLTEVADLRALAEQSDVVLSVCPPHAAAEVAERVAAIRPDGLLYIDANSIAPETVRRIAALFAPGTVVDAAVTGSPRLDQGSTVLWLAGPRAAEAAGLFTGSIVTTRTMGVDIGQASAFKACAGLRSKVIPAVWATLIDAAKAFGPEVEACVREHLADLGYDLAEQEAKIAERAPKAWRWVGEMSEAAKAMAEAGMPPGFSEAASQTYQRIADSLPER
jgi:3-hydroxyisobutyrate dehydrogenase-like beta-hydroxyacid dehydrogenase